MALVFVLFNTGVGTDPATALAAWRPFDCRTFGLLHPATAAAAAAAAVAVTPVPSAALEWIRFPSSCPPSLVVPGAAGFAEKEYCPFLHPFFFVPPSNVSIWAEETCHYFPHF